MASWLCMKSQSVDPSPPPPCHYSWTRLPDIWTLPLEAETHLTAFHLFPVYRNSLRLRTDFCPNHFMLCCKPSQCTLKVLSWRRQQEPEVPKSDTHPGLQQNIASLVWISQLHAIEVKTLHRKLTSVPLLSDSTQLRFLANLSMTEWITTKKCSSGQLCWKIL